MNIHVTDTIESIRLFKITRVGFYKAQIKQDHFILTGKKTQKIDFSSLEQPPSIKSLSDYSMLFFKLKGKKFKSIIGVKKEEALLFQNHAKSVFNEYIKNCFRLYEIDLQSISNVIDRLEQPQRYPSACLVLPYLHKAKEVTGSLPSTIPENLLSAKQLGLIEKSKKFIIDANKMRETAVRNFIGSELQHMADFFDSVESHPLTEEQRLAVITDEDATLVLAGAGSGKTSVIVVKASYLIKKAIASPKEVLLLAFANDAANEMAERVQQLTGESINAQTFHKLGNSIISSVEKEKPPLADHATDDVKYRAFLKDILVNDLSENTDIESTLRQWFIEFYHPYVNLWDFQTEQDYDNYIKENELRTLKGDIVKSFEELEIANWLFLNGVKYEYEPEYEHKLEKTGRRTYTPDFKLIESGVYIEHFGVRKKKLESTEVLTTAPYVDRDSYLKDMEWKRGVHKNFDTTLIETFSYEKVEGHLLSSLEEKIKPYVKLNPISTEEMFSNLQDIGQVDSFTQILTTFMKHFKGNTKTFADLYNIANNHTNSARNLAFLTIFESVFEVYAKKMGNRIDFEDMINRAANHVESGRYKSPYKFLLIDEFQDISSARARLVKAILKQHTDSRIFAVGDDWQAIYRFAGSDIHYMKNFGKEFGGKFSSQIEIHRIIDLGRTFRCVDKIALPARQFVLRNSYQIPKETIPFLNSEDANAIQIVHYDGDTKFNKNSEIYNLHKVLGQLSNNADKNESVLLLGRYNSLRPSRMTELKTKFPKLSLKFMSIHSSKGLEADHVVIMHAKSGAKGLPSEIADDPILNLVLPEAENYPHAEERRLFYVALTRAKRSVTILCDVSQPSPFASEIETISSFLETS